MKHLHQVVSEKNSQARHKKREGEGKRGARVGEREREKGG